MRHDMNALLLIGCAALAACAADPPRNRTGNDQDSDQDGGLGGGDASPGDEDPIGDPEPPGDPAPVDPCAMREVAVPIQDYEWQHVPDDVVVDYVQNPPASGPHRAMWARYQIHEEVIRREYWVHNLEHGAIVIVYRPDATAEVLDVLREAYEDLPMFHPPGPSWSSPTKLALMTADPLLDEPYAVLAWHWMLTSSCVPDKDAIVEFAVRRRDRGREFGHYGEGMVPLGPPCNRFITAVINEWTRVVPDGEPISYLNNPPTSGAHYATLAPYIDSLEVIPRGNWVGNLEKGGIVVLYRPDAPAELIQTLHDVYATIPNYWQCDDNNLTLLTPDPGLPWDMPWAVVAWDLYMTGTCVDDWALRAFILENRFTRPTSTCEQGPAPAPAPAP